MLTVNILINENKFKLTMTGHCGYSGFGNDIVCAAASILCLTIEEFLKKNKDKLEGSSVSIKHGRADISFEAKEEYRRDFSLVFSSLTDGFRLLYEYFPENITVNQ